MGRNPRAGRRVAGALLALAAGLALAQGAAPPAPQATAEVASEERRREGAARLMNELMLGQGVGGDFALTDVRGKRRRLADFRGKVVLLYFGFVTCPDICPTDLLEIGKALRKLGKDAAGVQPLFVTLDPARDTRAILREYAAAFHPRLIALRGSEREVAAVARAYKVFHEKVPIAGSAAQYTIDHSAFIYLIDRRGAYVGFLPPGTPSDRIARLLAEELKTGPL